MEITTAEYTRQDVTEEDLVEALRAFTDEDQFMILAEGERFMQAVLDGDGPYRIEFKDSDDPLSRDGQDQFYCDGVGSRGEVEDAFLQYFRGDPSWRSDREWRAVALEDAPGGLLNVVVVFGTLILVIGFLASTC